MATRTIFVGDVHGCAHELRDLLDACAVKAGDRVVLVGDLVAKGPDSRGVLAMVRERGFLAVRGNHDQAVLRWQLPLAEGSAPESGGHHLQLARTLDANDWATLESLPLFLRLPMLAAHGVLVVHAGLVHGVALAEQSPDLLLNMRTLRSDGSGSRRADAGVLWGSVWPGPELVLFGHHATAGLQKWPHAIGLDSGCVYGGELTAYVLPEQRFVSVPAREVYVPIEGPPTRGAS